jgi:serine/threonine protein kinase
MDLLGDNLSNLRRKCSNNVFSMKTTMALGMQMLAAIKFVHDAGFLHRDIKPGNFLVGKEKTPLERSVVIIDFGLSRRHLTRDGNPRNRRSHARWVGSRRYMSPNTHFRKDQGRRDDLWSFLYVLIEFCTGTLPWAHLRGLNNLDRVRDIKVEYMGEKLVRNLPAEFGQILNHIKSLGYADRPDYGQLHRIMKNLYESEGGDLNTPFDWMLVPTASGAGDHDASPSPPDAELPLHMYATIRFSRPRYRPF